MRARMAGCSGRKAPPADRLEADPTGYVLGKDQPKEYPAQ